MTGPTRDPLRNAGALIFPPPTAPAGHVPTFGAHHVDLHVGEAWCLGCQQVVTSDQWARELCPGPTTRRASVAEFTARTGDPDTSRARGEPLR